jgi:hypothetical protein
MAIGMGIGLLGDPSIVFKRPNRFTFTIYSGCIGTIPESFVKEMKRPQINQSEIKINFLNEQTYIPGRITYDTIDITYIDVSNSAAGVPLYQWLAQNFRFNDISKKQGNNRNDYSGTGYLTTYDGCGAPLDQFIYNDLWPTKVDFGEMKYDSDNETLNIKLTCRYTSVIYQSFCPGIVFPSCCSGCG